METGRSENFDLVLEREAAGSYRVRVQGSPEGETLWAPVRLPFTGQDMPSRVGGLDPATAQDLGAALFRSVFGGQVGVLWAGSVARADAGGVPLRLRLRLTDVPELAVWPWELLYDERRQGFLAMSERTPLLRYLDVPLPAREVTVDGPIRVLVMVAAPTDQDSLDSEREVTILNDALVDLQAAGRVHIVRVRSGRLEDLHGQLRGGIHVLHYIGHGGVDPDTGKAVLVLEGADGRSRLVDADDLAKVIRKHGSLRLVVLNACDGAHGHERDSFAGIAQTLVRRGLTAVVAMQDEITDQAAVTFARTLYEAIADRYPIDAAVSDARVALAADRYLTEWATPVLYLRAPDGRLFADGDPRGQATPAPGRQLVVGDLPVEATAFVERAVMDQLVAALQGSGRVNVCAVTGLRGVGKTQLAAAYARRCQQQGWSVVAWVNAQTRESALADLGRVAEAADLVREKEPVQGSVRRLVDRWNSDPARDRLVVFDNVVDADDLAGLIPQPGAATVVVTSARRLPAFGQQVDVGVFDSEQAVAYLTARTGLDDPAGAAKVAEYVGWLPVALAQAPRVIDRLRLSYAGYLQALDERTLARTLVREPGEPYPQSAAAALLLSVQAARGYAEDPRLTQGVMDTLAYLSPTGVRRDWLDELGAAFEVDDAVAGLVDLSLVTWADAAASEDDATLIMHRLVSRVIREEAATLGRANQAVVAPACVLAAVRPMMRDTYWSRRHEATALAAELMSLPAGSPLAERPELLHSAVLAVHALKVLHDPYTAIAVGEAALARTPELLGADHPGTLSLRNSLAGAYESTGDPARAIPLYQQIVADMERVAGADHPDTLTCRNNLAVAYQKAGKHEQATALFQQVLDVRLKILGADHRQTLNARHNLDLATLAVEEPQQAIPRLKRTLADTRRSLGPTDPDTLSSQNSLADAYELAGDLKRAIHLFQRTLDDRVSVLGEDHPDTLTSRINIARALWAAGRRTEGADGMSVAAESARRMFGSGDERTRQLIANHQAMTAALDD